MHIADNILRGRINMMKVSLLLDDERILYRITEDKILIAKFRFGYSR